MLPFYRMTGQKQGCVKIDTNYADAAVASMRVMRGTLIRWTASTVVERDGQDAPLA
jgi:hypothetical protein